MVLLCYFMGQCGHGSFEALANRVSMTAGGQYDSERGISHLLPVPHVAVQILGACQGAVFSPQSLKKIVLQDSAFCARLIDIAAKTCPAQIDPSAPLSSSLNHLGLSVVKSLAIQAAKRLVEAQFTAPQAQFMRELWFYSQVGGITARCLAESISYPDPEEAQLTGLLLNVGMLSLFSKKPSQYQKAVASSLSSKEIRGQEQVAFDTDHIRVADSLISGWGLDSFMADAVSFAHLDMDQCRDASTLIRMARLTLEFCRSPFALSDEIYSVAENLFSFTRSDTEYLFALAEKQYHGLSPFNGSDDECLEEVGRVQKRLTSMVFSIADQEGIRSQLSDSLDMESFVATARHLYQHNSPAQEAIFFVADLQSGFLTGQPCPEQGRLVGELKAPLTGGNLLAEALQGEGGSRSFERNESDLSIFDRQLIRQCKGRGVVCLPLRINDRLLGGVALGIESVSEAESLNTPQFQLLHAAVARGIALLPVSQVTTQEVESAPAEASLIPKLVHEVSNPLTIINNYMSVLGTVLSGTENAELLPAIENEVKRISDILKYYTDLQDEPQQADSTVDVNAMILSVIESLTPTFFRPKQIEILTDFDSSLRPLLTKSVVIKQILVNLLKNAAEALSVNGKIALMTREHKASDGQYYVNISVQDNGPGIPQEIQDRLFSPVTSTKGGDHAGLGLNIVKGMVDDIGAKISCHSSAEFGTSFNLVIPRVED